MSVNLQDFKYELNTNFMKNILQVKETERLIREQCKLNLNTNSHNQTTFGYKGYVSSDQKFETNFLIILNQVKT